MTYRDHTANFRRFQAAIVCEQCHALYETCPHHTRGIRAALRSFWLRSALPARFARWARRRDQHELAKLRTQIAALHAQLSEAEGRLDAETARRKNAEQRLAREKLAHAGYLAASAPGKVRAKG